MSVDPSQFFLLNVVDTCAVWNVLSSRVLYGAALQANCAFCCTQFVHYECLRKPRKNSSPDDRELRSRLEAEISKGKFQAYHLEIEDLQDVSILERRKKLSKGELSSIAFAKKTNQAFLTDDQKARKLAEEVLDGKRIQTTPHLFGWLVFSGVFQEGEKSTVISEHQGLGRPLAPHFENIFETAVQYREMAAGSLQQNA